MTDRPGLLRLVLVLLLLTAGGRAAAYAPPYPILDGDQAASLGLFLAWYEDRGNRLALDDVRAIDPARFTVSERDRLQFGFRHSTLWFRVALQNTRTEPAQLVLEVPHPGLSLVEFYQPVDGGYRVTSAGTGTERVIADFPHRTYLFSTRVEPGTTQVYWFRVRADLPLDFSLLAESPEAFAHQQGLAQIATGLFLGLLLAMAVLLALSWAITRRSTHGWYLLSLSAALLFLLARLGYLGVQFLPQPGLHTLLEAGAAMLATLGGVQFARVFLDTRRLAPEFDQWLGYLVLAAAVCVLATPWMDPAQLGPAYTTLAALAMPATLVAAWLARRQPETLHYAAARLSIAVPGALVVAGDWNLLPTPLPAAGLLIVGATLEACITGTALYLRHRRLQQEESGGQLREAISRAEQLARSDLIGRFSHDVRTPLNGMLGMTELLGDTTLTPRQRDYVLTIRAAGENLLTLLNDTLDWTQLDSGQLQMQHVDFDLAQLVADSLESVQLRAEEKHLELVVDIDRAVPLRVNGDPSRLRQVLCNLLANAVRSTHSGEIQVQVTPAGQPHQLRIEVRDTGVGIPRERLATLFERGTGSRADVPQAGQGLGLVIARQLVERMGGSIGVHSEEHRGSTFWLVLPLPAAPEQVVPGQDLRVLADKRLLVVDDNAAMRRVIETQATGWGMQVTVADNGQEALAIARTQANLGLPFDVVILDHNMPGMSGLQLAARIKEDPLIRNDALLVMLTGLNIAPSDTMARNVGIRRVLTKPVAGRTLQAALAEELVRRERLEPASPASPLPATLRVLVVEDNHLSQKVIRGMLAKLGVRSDIVGNGQEAIDAIQHHRYDLVLMDCEMPVVDGYEATRRIRAWETDNARRRTPVVALSAHIMQEIKERCRQAGMDAHMAKPVDLNELRETLRIYSGA